MSDSCWTAGRVSVKGRREERPGEQARRHCQWQVELVADEAGLLCPGACQPHISTASRPGAEREAGELWAVAGPWIGHPPRGVRAGGKASASQVRWVHMRGSSRDPTLPRGAGSWGWSVRHEGSRLARSVSARIRQSPREGRRSPAECSAETGWLARVHGSPFPDRRPCLAGRGAASCERGALAAGSSGRPTASRDRPRHRHRARPGSPAGGMHVLGSPKRDRSPSE